VHAAEASCFTQWCGLVASFTADHSLMLKAGAAGYNAYG